MNKEKLYPYLIPLVFILIGAGGLALVWKVETKWISMPVGLISILLMIIGLMWVNLIADTQMNAYTEENKENQVYHSFPGARKQKIIYYTITGMGWLLSFALIISGSKVENYLNWKSYVLELVLIGGGMGLIVTWFYYKKLRIRFDNMKWDENIHVAIFLLLLMITLHSSVWYNHLKSSPVDRIIKTVATRDGGKYLHLEFENDKQRFQFRRAFNESIKKGDTVWLTIKRGALGYAYAEKPSKTNN